MFCIPEFFWHSSLQVNLEKTFCCRVVSGVDEVNAELITELLRTNVCLLSRLLNYYFLRGETVLTELKLSNICQGKTESQMQAWKITSHCPATHNQARKIRFAQLNGGIVRVLTKEPSTPELDLPQPVAYSWENCMQLILYKKLLILDTSFINFWLWISAPPHPLISRPARGGSCHQDRAVSLPAVAGGPVETFSSQLSQLLLQLAGLKHAFLPRCLLPASAIERKGCLWMLWRCKAL